MDISQFTNWIQVSASVATLATAYYAYRTLDHMRRSSSEDALRELIARTHKECGPICEQAVRNFRVLAESLNGQLIAEGDPNQIAAVLNTWETVASGINSGAFNQEVFYLLAKNAVLKQYRSLSWYVRQQRLTDEHSYNELEKLVDCINEINCSTFAVTASTLRRLRSLRVPAYVIQVVKKTGRTSSEVVKKTEGKSSAKLLDRLKKLFLGQSSPPDTWNRFETRLNHVATRCNASIALYKAVIFASTRCHPLPIVKLDADARGRQLRSNELLAFASSELSMYREIYNYTGHKYPELTDGTDDSLAQWCAAEEKQRLCQLIIFDNTKAENRKKRKILGHVSLSKLTVDKRWDSVVRKVRQVAEDKLVTGLEQETCIVARDLYFDKNVKNLAHGQAILRAVLRRAIQMVEEGHLAQGRHRHWLLLGLVPSKLPENASDLSAQERVIEQEGGRLLHRFRSPKEIPVDIYVFGQQFKKSKVEAKQAVTVEKEA